MEHATFPEAARAGRFELDEQEFAIRELAQDFALTEIAPHAIEWDQEKTFPVETLRAAAALGMGGITWARSTGAAG